MSVRDEFMTVDLILDSSAETRGVDAFALSLIKAEKQARRLVTYLVFQYPWCTRATVPELRKALESNTRVFFKGLLAGWNVIYPRSVEQIVGAEYKSLRARLDDATKYRNKIFHGQLTSQALSRPQLLALVEDIRAWCQALAAGADAAVGYDGCGPRSSFRKARNPAALCATYKLQLENITQYRRFIEDHMARP